MKLPRLVPSLLAMAAVLQPVSAPSADMYFRVSPHSIVQATDDGEAPPPGGGTQNEDDEDVSLSFASVDGAAPSSFVESAPSLYTGPVGDSVLTASGGDIRTCSAFDCSDAGAYAPTATVTSGMYVQIRMEAPPLPGFTGAMMVLRDDVSIAAFEVSTAGIVPSLSSLGILDGVEPDTVLESGLSLLSGLDGTAAVSGVAGAELRACSGVSADCSDWTSLPVAVADGDQIQVRGRSGTFSETSIVSLDVGDLTENFWMTVRDRDGSPDPFAFAATTGLEPGTESVSASVALTGHDGVAVSLASGSDASARYMVCASSTCADGVWTKDPTPDVASGTFVRAAATPSAFGATASAVVVAGTEQAVFEATSRQRNGTPSAISFAPVAGANPGVATVSSIAVLEGHDGVDVSLAAGSDPSSLYRICATATCEDGTWTANPTPDVPSGRRVQMSVVAPTFSSTASAELVAGTRTAAFSVSTRPKDETPDDFSFASVADAEAGVPVASEAVRISGHDGVTVSLAASSDPTSAYRICSSQACTDGTWTAAPTSDVPADGWISVRTTPSAWGARSEAVLVAGTVSRTYAATAGTRPEIAASSPPAGTAGTPYAGHSFSATGGSGGISFSSVASTLPPGLVLSAQGGLSGTPSAAGTYAFDVVATDAKGRTGTMRAVVAISQGADLTPEPFSFPSGFVASRNVWTTSEVVRLVGHDGVDVTVASANIAQFFICPDKACTTKSSYGASQTGRAADGDWVGVMSYSSDYDAPVSVVLKAGTESATFSFRTATQLTGTGPSQPMPNGKIGTPYSATFTVAGGAAPYQWTSVYTLPPGMTLTGTGSNTAVLSGTPSGAFPASSVRLNVKDAVGQSLIYQRTFVVTN